MSVPSAASARSGALRALQQQLLGSHSSAVTQQIIPTGISALDTMLPNGGMPTAAVIEWVSEFPGLSAAGIALHCIRSYLTQPGCLAVVDSRHEFHAAAVELAGIAMARLLLIRPCTDHDLTLDSAMNSGIERERERGRGREQGPGQGQREALWALEQAARCSGVRVVLCWLDRVSSTALRRLQLAVERSGVTVFLIRPASALKQPSWADYRLLVEAVATSSSERLDGAPTEVQTSGVSAAGADTQILSVQLLRSRHSVRHHGRALLKMDYETGTVFTISELACSEAATTVAE